MQPTTSTSTCAVHAGALATFTCSRCGAFACAACASPEPQLCAACDRRRGSVLGTDVSAGGLIGDAFRLVGRFGSAVGLLALADGAASLAVTGVGAALPKSMPFVIGLALVSAAASSIIQAAWISLLASAAHAAPVDTATAFRRGLSRALPLFACNFVLALAVAIGFALLIVPGVILFLGLCLGAPAVVAGERGPMDALGESWDLTGAHRLDLLLAFLATGGVALVASVGFALATSLLLRVAPAVPHLLVQVCGELVRTVAAAPIITVSVLAYLRLSRRFTDGD